MALIDTEQFTRTNPAMGLMQGLQTGANFGLALRQQQMAEKQAEQSRLEKERTQDLQMAGTLLEAASKVQSRSMKAQYAQQANDLIGKYIPKYSGLKVDPNDESLDELLAKGPKFKKAFIDNPDVALKDYDAYIMELGEKQAKGEITEQQYKSALTGAESAKKGAASEMAGLATYPNQFAGQKEYSTPEAKTGIEGYQQNIVSQMNAFDPSQANIVRDDLLTKRKMENENFKAATPWGFYTDSDGNQKALGWDATSKKVVTYDMPKGVNGQVTPFALGRTPASEVSKGVMLDTIKGNLKRINDKYDANYVGMIAGRAGQLQASTVGGIPQKQVEFYADVNDIADMLLRARSGAQINEQEYNRLSKLVPTPNLPAKTFEARLKRFEEQLDEILSSQRGRLSQGGYMVPTTNISSPAKSNATVQKQSGRFTITEVPRGQ